VINADFVICLPNNSLEDYHAAHLLREYLIVTGSVGRAIKSKSLLTRWTVRLPEDNRPRKRSSKLLWQRTQLLLERREQNDFDDSPDLNQEDGIGKLQWVTKPSAL
jgi:hypothetical protein